MIFLFQPKTWMVTTWITSAKIMSNPVFSTQPRLSCLLWNPYIPGRNSIVDKMNKKDSLQTLSEIRLFRHSNSVTVQYITAKITIYYRKLLNDRIFVILKAIGIMVTIFWHVMPFIVVETY
jgi:hypothetical protein